MIKYYPFELHTHTKHSDGSMTPHKLLESARQRGLTGIALTDHNTITGLEEAKKIAKEMDLVLIEGIEWTTFWGHLTVLGGKSDIDWRDINKTNINQMIKRASDMGDIVNIAHPKRMGLPVCAGCHFDYEIDTYQFVTGFEVWSNPKPAYNKVNQLALEQYDELSSQGIKWAVLYGDDWHDVRSNRKQYAKTYLGINGEPNAANALEAIRQRRTYISTGITLEIKMSDADGKDIQLGQTIERTNLVIDCKLELDKEYCERYAIKPLSLVLKGTALNKECKYEIVDNRVEARDITLRNGYIRYEIEGLNVENNMTLLITSPIYVEDNLC